MSKKRFKVSVCVPVYNAEKYLDECLKSLLNQTLDGIQIVCVDDGSTDNSSMILDKYSKQYENIKVIHQKNQGLGGARNTGIDNSDGEFIGFLDADDFVSPKMYETLYNLAKKNNSELVICNTQFYPHSNTKKHVWYKPYCGKIDADFLDRNIQPGNKIVSKKLIDRIGFRFFKKNGDDMYIFLLLGANGISTIDKKYYYYRVGHNTMSNTFKIDSFLNFIDCTKTQIEELQKTKYAEELKEYFDYRMIYVLIQTIAVAALKRDYKVFKMCKNMLVELNYKKNKYLDSILKKEFSRIEYYGMVDILPINYTFSSLLMSVKLKGWK